MEKSLFIETYLPSLVSYRGIECCKNSACMDETG